MVTTVKPVLSGHPKRTPKIGFQYRLLINEGQKYCRMLQGEHSAILWAFIKLPFSIKTFILSIFKWPLKTGFTYLNLTIGRSNVMRMLLLGTWKWNLTEVPLHILNLIIHVAYKYHLFSYRPAQAPRL